MQASAPPVTAHVTCPARIMWNASPIAWVAEAQALATAKAGPRSPQCMEIWLAGAFTISLGMVKGWSRVALVPIDAAVVFVLGRLPADPGSDDGGGSFRQPVVE